MNALELNEIFSSFLKEDIGSGDYSSLACIPASAQGSAKLLLKEDGVIAGLQYILPIFKLLDTNASVTLFKNNGDYLQAGTILAEVNANSQALLSGERVMLNLLQRMSGIATLTKEYCDLISNYKTQLLDTRKTIPGLRFFDKEAVKVGGGVNHRIGLYDMVMIKDNHIDYAGGISKAISNCEAYLAKENLDLKIEVEARNMDEVQQIMQHDSVFRIMLDNFHPSEMKAAIDFIGGKKQTEASGGITKETLEDYAKTGVDYISVGALTHSVKGLDISFKEAKAC